MVSGKNYPPSVVSSLVSADHPRGFTGFTFQHHIVRVQSFIFELRESRKTFFTMWLFSPLSDNKVRTLAGA